MPSNKTYTLRALNLFNCTAEKCPRNCCSESWSYPVDGATLEKWNSIADNGVRTWFLNALQEKDSEDLIKLKILPDKRCCFLDQDGLCEIQNKYDQTYLPSICRSFPRTIKQTPQITYETAWFSCPEITRLVLEGDKGHDPFVTSQGKHSQSGATSGLLQNVVMSDASLFAMLDDWQTMVLDLDKFPIGLRLFFLASVYAQLVQQTQSGKLSKSLIETLQQNTRKNLYEMNLAFKQGRLTPNPVTAGAYWKVIVEFCAASKINSVYMGGIEERLLSTITACDGSPESYAGIHQVIRDYRQQHQSAIRENYTSMLKPFMRNYFAASGFPLQPVSSKHGITFIKCLSGLCILQLLLWLAAERNTELTPQLLQDLVVEVHRRFIHNNTTEQRLQQDVYIQNFGAYSICAVDLF